MKKVQSKIFILAVSILFFGCTENALLPALDDSQLEQEAYLKSAKKPTAKLVGESDCLFTFTPPTFWNGTVDLEGYDEYGLTFFSSPDPPRDYSQASPFYETWVIYYLGTDYNDDANVLMRGWNKGVVTFANKMPEPVNFHANGKVTEAYGPLEAWEGCNWHIKGIVHWIAPRVPEKAVGQVRIN